MDYSTNRLRQDIIKQINKEVALINQDYTFMSPGCPREQIFELLEEVGTLIFYPIKEDNLWGIYIYKNEKHYFIINSSIELEKQIFAGAHELAHSLDIAKVRFKLVTAELMTEYVDDLYYGTEIKKADLIANRFAAELLVGRKSLREKFSALPESYSLLVKAVLLSDTFLVPYKTIVKRFKESDLITDDSIINDLLDKEQEQIRSIADRYECCRRNYEITGEERLGGYVNKALTLYENELSTYKELQNRLVLLEKAPEDYGIHDLTIDSYDLLRRASENSEVEDGNISED